MGLYRWINNVPSYWERVTAHHSNTLQNLTDNSSLWREDRWKWERQANGYKTANRHHSSDDLNCWELLTTKRKLSEALKLKRSIWRDKYHNLKASHFRPRYLLCEIMSVSRTAESKWEVRFRKAKSKICETSRCGRRGKENYGKTHVNNQSQLRSG